MTHRSRFNETRAIGPAGTAARVLGGLALLYLAGALEGLPWDVDWYDPIVGLLVIPAATLGIGLLARRRGRTVRFTGPAGHALNSAIIVALVVNPYTAGGAGLFYAATMLLAAWKGQAGCETTVISNLLLRRDDQVGCAVFLPVDVVEAGLRRRPAAPAHD